MFWDRNLFTHGYPALEQVFGSPYVRGAVTGVGVITAIAGVAELGSVFAARARRETPPPPPV